MNYKSFLLGFICCTILGFIAFKTKPFLNKKLFCYWQTKTTPSLEQQAFPILEHDTYPFTLPALDYEYASLEPHIDAKTLETHRIEHHKLAIENLNKALKDFPAYQQKTIIYLLENLNQLPEKLSKAIINYGGSHFDHTLYFTCMSPDGGTLQAGTLNDHLQKTFTSLDAFKELFEAEAKNLLGSGWVWLCLDNSNQLRIFSSKNYETPFAQGLFPLLVLDVWEHAYYLKYQNKRINYVKAWWHVVNWLQVESLYYHALKKHN